MSLNGISTSTYKADRQAAKLALAQAKRQGLTVADDGTGDPLRVAFNKINQKTDIMKVLGMNG